MLRPVSGGCWGEARESPRLRIQGAFQWHGYPDPVFVETCCCARTYSHRGIFGLCTRQIGNLQCGASAPCGAVMLCADVACLAWAGWIGDQRGPPFRPERTPRSLLETRPAKEAKETDGRRWKTPRLFDRGRKGMAVRTKWQSGRAGRRHRAAALKGEPPPPATGGAPRGNPTRT